MPNNYMRKRGFTQHSTFVLRKKLSAGFTLIELLVVISIIGLLSSVVLASLNEARMKARDTQRISDLQQIRLALELYRDDNGAYPAGANTIFAASYSSSFSAINWDSFGAILSPYISSMPYDPTSNLSVIQPITTLLGYTYWSNSGESAYMLMARFETGNNLACNNKDYEPLFDIFAYPTGASFCPPGGNNDNLYVVDSGN